jgi:hypothetical protein
MTSLLLRRFAWSAAVLASMLVGCPGTGTTGNDDDAGPSDGGIVENFVGDPNAEPEGELLIYDPRQSPPTSSAHDPQVIAPMIFGPQGGYMVLLGARVRNMDISSLQISGSVRDQCFDPARIVGITQAPMFARERDGWGVPDDGSGIAAYLNMQLCPNTDASRDTDGHEFDVSVRVTDRARRTVVMESTITAECKNLDGTTDTVCTCQCDSTYELGEDCFAAGADDDTGDPAPGECPSN